MCDKTQTLSHREIQESGAASEFHHHHRNRPGPERFIGDTERLSLVAGDNQSDPRRIDAQGLKSWTVEVAAFRNGCAFLDDQGVGTFPSDRPFAFQPREQKGGEGAGCAPKVASDLMDAEPQAAF